MIAEINSAVINDLRFLVSDQVAETAMGWYKAFTVFVG
jgi:hypothetical protein